MLDFHRGLGSEPMYHPEKYPQDPRQGRSVNAVTGRTHYRSQTVQLAIGGMGGIVAIMMVIGLMIARLTTSTINSAETVVICITIVGSLVAGFVAAPLFADVAFGVNHRKRQHED